MPERLHPDICRCYDDGCPERHDCLRWLDRERGAPYVFHVPSLKDYDRPLSDPCSCRIPPTDHDLA